MDPELEALGFLAGCWRSWSVDWGYTTCWRREGATWVGTYRSGGSMGPSDRVRFRISRAADGTLRLVSGGTCGGRFRQEPGCTPALVGRPRIGRRAAPRAPRDHDCERDRHARRACAVAEPLMIFGDGEQAIWLGSDRTTHELVFGTGGGYNVPRARPP